MKLDKVRLHHITHVNNLASIVQHGCIYSRNIVEAKDISGLNVSHSHIQSERAEKYVPCKPGGTLHDYVPFFFAPRPAMLYAIHSGWVEGYSHGQEPIIYLLSDLREICKSKLKYVFTDAHATQEFARFYNDESHLDQLDWDSITLQSWFEKSSDPIKYYRRQSEFLIRDQLPVSFVKQAVVSSESIKTRVSDVPRRHDCCFEVKVDNSLYY